GDPVTVRTEAHTRGVRCGIIPHLRDKETVRSHDCLEQRRLQIIHDARLEKDGPAIDDDVPAAATAILGLEVRVQETLARVAGKRLAGNVCLTNATGPEVQIMNQAGHCQERPSLRGEYGQ